MRILALLGLIGLAWLVGLAGQAARPNTAVGRCPILPADNVWNTPVIGLPVHPASAATIEFIGAAGSLKADFGAGLWNGGPIGIPYTTADRATPRRAVTFEYDDESDPGPYPIPDEAPIEGGPASAGDRHVLIVDQGDCRLYELYAAYPNPDGSWRAGSGAIFDLRGHALRPVGWTSADAAGLPILPGLARYDEAAAGVIPHALRFTVQRTQRAWVWPARHYASTSTDPVRPPMGLRLRLKAGFDESPFPPQARAVLRALKRYGMLVADNGANWFISGAPDPRWNNDDLTTLRQVKGADFEVVDTRGMMLSPDSGRAKPPCAWIDFDADQQVGLGDAQAVAAHWPHRPVAGAEARYDLDGDGDIDIADLVQVTSRWGLACS